MGVLWQCGPKVNKNKSPLFWGDFATHLSHFPYHIIQKLLLEGKVKVEVKVDVEEQREGKGN